MSGIEVFGIVASVIQIADFGARLSVKLCTFSRKVKHANKDVRDISNDVALTCNVLRELGETLKKDEKANLCSNDAITTAERIIGECMKVFTGLDEALEERLSGRKFLKIADRLKYPFLEPRIDLMRHNLERLKSTLLLMLNVIIYAGLLRRHDIPPFTGLRVKG